VLNRYADPREAVDRLIELALDAGAPENVTAVIGDVVAEEPAMPSRPRPRLVRTGLI
jgi:protein phosphatase